MKVYILPIEKSLQPLNQNLLYPNHNRDYGVEQDFLKWLNTHAYLTTNNPDEADWHYLPVFWTRWHINHNFAANGEGLRELQAFVGQAIINSEKTFTITQFDGGTLIDLGETIEFTAAKTTNNGIDIPILCSLHKMPLFPVRKKFIASFNGSFDTHQIREEIRTRFTDDRSVNIAGNLTTRFYKRWLQGKQFNLNILASYVALCPRGTSANSFRFFEAMQFGVAPCLIGDIDVRPFQKFINWNEMSYYVANVDELVFLLSNLNKRDALKKGGIAKSFFRKELYYQKWCSYVIKELTELS